MHRSPVGIRPFIAALTCALFAAGCGGDSKDGPFVYPDFSMPEASIRVDGRIRDLGSDPDGLPVDTEGPTIEILTPEADQIIVGNVLRVTAKIEDPDGIDSQTVNVTLQGADPVSMGLTSTPGVYEAILDIGNLEAGKTRIWVVAGDLQGNDNSQVRIFERDAGPIVKFLSPAEESRHKSSVSLQVVVADSFPITAFSVSIGTQALTMTKTANPDGSATYAAQIKFDDPMFGLPLSGKQVLTAVADNANGARTTVQRVFFVDDEGPLITIQSHAAGQLIGSIIEVVASVTDPAGVLSSSVRCVIGNNLENRDVVLAPDPTSPGVFSGQFDTRTLSNTMLWPVMSVRAADKLGNESHRDIEVALDNGPPIVSLDPPEDFYAARIRDQLWECSLPFDPLGSDAPDDLERCPQFARYRVRIEDQGNDVPTAPFEQVALVDPATVWLYVLPASVGKPLVVDTDGDGYCDSINPEVVPIGSTPQPGEAVAVNLDPVGQAGAANFLPTSPLPEGCVPGTDTKPQDPLCDTVPADLTFVITYLVDDEPSIWAIPDVISGHDLKCMGLAFDYRANDIGDGWVCAAAAARDTLGTLGVSRPIRNWVDLERSSKVCGPEAPPAGAPAAPSCTGTLDKTTGKVNNTPCTFRPQGMAFPQEFLETEIRKF